MKKLILVLFAAVAISSFGADSTVKGYLVDLECAAEKGGDTAFWTKHNKDCLQMPECVKGGYGVLTEDKKILKFDKASNEKAKQFIAGMQKAKDIKVSVTGTVNGENMAVNKIELQ